MKYKVMITDTCFPDTDIERNELEKIDAELIVSEGTDEKTLIETGKDCDGIIFDYAQITDEILSNLPKCKVAARYGIGVNTIDIDAASRNGIMVANVPDYCLDEVSDHAIALSLACSRRITQYNDRTKNKEWDVTSIGPVYRMEGKNFCLYGLGNIAQKVAAKAKVFNFNIFAYDPYVGDEIFKKASVKRVESLEELASIADVLSIHAPLTAETKFSINADIFKLMKKNSILINTSRGPVVNEKDLIEALKQKMIMGAGLDVLMEEPPKENSELLELDNVIVTPHVAFYSAEAEEELRRRVAREVIYGITEGAPHSFINKEAF